MAQLVVRTHDETEDFKNKQLVILKPKRPKRSRGPSKAKQVGSILAINKQLFEEAMKDPEYEKKREKYLKALTKRAHPFKTEYVDLIISENGSNFNIKVITEVIQKNK